MKTFHAIVVSMFLAFIPTVHAAPIDINTADAQSLDKGLTGVSPKTAKAIVDYRGKNGLFKSVNDLSNVKGISKAIIEKNRSKLVVGP